MISIINYGLGNLGSIKNMFRYIGQPCQIIENPDELKNAEKIILPGVGSFDAGMKQLQENGWIDVMNDMVLQKKVPILGICLGMQLMTNFSEEGKIEGLKWIDAETRKFKYDEDKKLKIPHMEWTDVEIKKESALFDNVAEYNRFYFVHSYYVKVNNSEEELLSSNYIQDFTAGFSKDNIYGVQFHPEKSHKFGMKLLQNFANI